MIENVAVIILAAGMGTRMKSNKAKVLHEILGKPMIIYVVETARKVAGENVILVVGNQAEKVRKIVSRQADVIYAYQDNQLGTGHAVSCALPHVPGHCRDVVILCGDAPLITAETVFELIEDHLRARRDISLLAVEVEDPQGYGRVLLDEKNQFCGIVEESDATEEQKRIRQINSGIYCIKKRFLKPALAQVTSDNVQGEMYLTDIIQIGYRERKKMGLIFSRDHEEILGINKLQDLIQVESIMQKRLRIIS